jgi:hypothetical protein
MRYNKTAPCVDLRDITEEEAEVAAQRIAELLYDLVLEVTLPKAREVMKYVRDQSPMYDGDSVTLNYDLTLGIGQIAAIFGRIKREKRLLNQ